MRSASLLSPLLLGSLLLSPRADAQTASTADPSASPAARPDAASPRPAVEQGFSESLVLDSARINMVVPVNDSMIGEIHGEYQLRYARRSELALTPPARDPNATTLGQRNAMYHWLRLSPRFFLTRRISIVGQIDFPRGLMAGETTQFVGLAAEPMSERQPFGVDPRWLYLDAVTHYGQWRVGQQPSHWGMGIVANDGNHPSLFGDYRRGAVVERIMFATRPAGKATPLVVALAGDLVFRDNQATLTDRDVAFQGLVALLLGNERNQLGLYGIVRHQTRADAQAATPPYTDRLDTRTLDANGRFTVPVAGAPGYVFGQAEAVVVTGSTRFVQGSGFAAPQDSAIRAFGGAFTLGTVHEAVRGSRRWGDLVVAFEWGYASGDSNPFDGAQRRFTFDPNHKVGLVLFDHALAWASARSAVNASLASNLPSAPATQFYPSNGGVFGATYLYPTLVVRPWHWLDLKGAMLLAQSTCWNIDPYRTGTTRVNQGSLGADPARRDLGMELDFGTEVRVPMQYDVTLQLGAQAGILFPGHAFDTVFGNGLANQYVALGRLGLQF
jgi:hypothetical protein